MSSSDPRFRNAAEDARQHLINNEDWDDDYTFLDRFRLIEGQEEDFIKFVNVVISPDVRHDKQEINKYINAIEKVLPKGYNFHEVIDDNGNKKIELSTTKKHDEYEYPVNLPHNTIKFYVDRKPDTLPAFCLTSNTWDDFGYKTTFELSYTSNGDRSHSLGNIKIFKEGVLTTMECIPDVFTTLPDSFCSLMQSKAGYRNLKRLRPNDYASVLFGIRDSAYYPEIRDRFETISCFKSSLLRDYESPDILSNIKRKLERGENIDNWDFTVET